MFPWEFDNAGWSRRFDGTARAAGPVTVTITGQQFDDGAVRGVALDLGGVELLDGDEARSLAAVLLDAASELERLR